MAEWRPFNASNEKGTCLWCGRKLRKQRHGEGRGDYGDGFFCGLSCGYLFAYSLAVQGRTLAPKNK